jgi:serine/threonine protein kinase
VDPARADLARDLALAKLKQRLFNRDVAVKIGRYHVLALVGAGGWGVVWGAWDPELDRRVAIKLVKASLPALRERMLLEGKALARLSHPNVIAIHDVGALDEQVYLVTEWVRGDNLRVYARTPRTVRELVAVYRQAGEGLAAAHAAGLVHRDFKPENAIRGEDGRVRVLDFGLALDEQGGEAAPGGTPRYMAPEQAAGGKVTPAADQYAFATSLREALLARPGDGRPA